MKFYAKVDLYQVLKNSSTNIWKYRIGIRTLLSQSKTMGIHKSEDELVAEYKKTLEGKKLCDCEECKGTGLIEKTLGGSGDPEFEAEVFCWDCMGTGEVVQTVTIVDGKGTRTAEVDLAKSFDKFKEVNQLLRDWDEVTVDEDGDRIPDGSEIEDYELGDITDKFDMDR